MVPQILSGELTDMSVYLSSSAIGWPGSTGEESSIRNLILVADTCDLISWKFFITSTSPKISPTSTASPSSLKGVLSGDDRR